MKKTYPFKFLKSYSRADTDIFFGRDEEIKTLYKMVFQTDILLLYGASGTGKTSLINCGLAREFNDYDWLALDIRRGKNINESLQHELARHRGDVIATEDEDEEDLYDEDDLEMEEEAISVPLSPLQQQLKAVYLNYFRPVYLIFDQFEELFIIEDNQQEQQLFTQTVKEILSIQLPVKMIFIIREEYLGHLYHFERAIPQLTQKKLRIEPMNLEKVREVIYNATALEHSVVQLQVEEKEVVTQQIFDIVKGKDKSRTIQLPYLQVFMDKLYLNITADRERQQEAVITTTALADPTINKIENVLRDFLDEQVGEIRRALVTTDTDLTEADIWKMLSPFATLDGTKKPISRADLVQELKLSPTLIDRLLQLLQDNRILIYVEKDDLYEIAHDSLAQQIALKRSDDEIALLEVRRLIRTQANLDSAVRELFSDRQLDFIEPYLVRNLNLKENEKQLVDKSQAARIIRHKNSIADQQAKLHAAHQRAEAERERAIQEEVLKDLAELAKEKAVSSEQRALKAQRKAEMEKSNALAAKKEAEIEKSKALVAKQNAILSESKAKKLLLSTVFVTIAVLLLSANIYWSSTKLKQSKLETEKALLTADVLNSKNETLIDAFYFFDGKFALAVKEVKVRGAKIKVKVKESFTQHIEPSEIRKINDLKEDGDMLIEKSETTSSEYFEERFEERFERRYGFINKQGRIVIDYKYKQAEQFDDTGFAKVVFSDTNAEEGTTYLIDTTDNRYKVAYQLENLTNDITALDLRNTGLSTFPEIILKNTQLEILLLGQNSLKNIPITIANLPNLKVLDISSTNIKELPGDIVQLQKLEILNLSHTEIVKLPRSIGQLSQLKQLTLSHVKKIKEIPHSIGRLNNLQKLDLSHSGIIELTDSIGQLKKLRYLNLNSTKNIRRLPNSIGQIHSLQKLDISNTVLINKLGSAIGELINLRELILRSSNIYELSDSIVKLEKLQVLDLGYTKISRLPHSIERLTKLQKLDLANIEIYELPNSIGLLKELQTLSIDFTGVSHLPPEIGKLKRLKKLSWSIAHSKGVVEFVRLPKEIGQLKNLQELSIQNHKADIVLPEEIKELKNLKVLNLSSTGITKLPNTIGQLDNLVELNLSNTKIAVLPNAITNLKKLERIYLNSCQLDTFPMQIVQLNKLNKLRLSNNKLKKIPIRINKLANLTELDLSSNQFREFPVEILALTELRELNLNNNQLNQIPIQIGQLSMLNNLNLGSNRLKEFPEQLLQITSLVLLDLSSNQINNFPKRIKHLIKLTDLNLNDNQLKEFPMEVLPLTKLARLQLRENRLERIPVQIGRLSNLRELNLNNNQLEKIPDEITRLEKLSVLDLANNPLKEFPIKIGRLGNLTDFNFDFRNVIITDEVFNYSMTPEIWKELAFKFSQQQDYIQEIRAILKILETEASDYYFYSRLALAYIYTNQYNRAKEIFLSYKDETVHQTWAIIRSDGGYFYLNNGQIKVGSFFLNIIEMEESVNNSHPDFKKAKELLRFYSPEKIMKSYMSSNQYFYEYADSAIFYIKNHRYDKAEAIIQSFKNISIPEFGERITVRQLFLDAIEYEEKHGNTHPDFAKAKKLLTE